MKSLIIATNNPTRLSWKKPKSALKLKQKKAAAKAKAKKATVGKAWTAAEVSKLKTGGHILFGLDVIQGIGLKLIRLLESNFLFNAF